MSDVFGRQHPFAPSAGAPAAGGGVDIVWLDQLIEQMPASS